MKLRVGEEAELEHWDECKYCHKADGCPDLAAIKGLELEADKTIIIHECGGFE